ncbi:MAG TPA: ArgE/DapE family deacylase [Burkholderiaceae bacterium]
MTTQITTVQLAQAVEGLEHYMIDTLGGFVAAPSPSGAEQPAAAFLESALNELGLECERIPLNSKLLQDMPMFSCPCDPDNGRYNLLARHVPKGGLGHSVLFNGHMDVVPTGPAELWSEPPYASRAEDGWIYGRGAGDMKGGIVCALAAYKALKSMGLEPAGTVGFNAVLDEENTGNGTLATVHALQNAMAQARLTDFNAVIIPEPFGETVMAAQVGVSWLSVTLTGRPAHVAYMHQGLNPIEACVAILEDLKELEAQWNAPENKHPLFKDVEHPLNFNLGRIEGGEWSSSVPCTCTLSLRCSYYPGVEPDDAVALISARIRAKARQLNPALEVDIDTRGHRSPGCVYDLDTPAMRTLAAAHQKATGQAPEHLSCTATTDGRHFQLMTDIPVTVYGPVARNIHGVDEAVSLASMKRVATSMAQFMVDWCGVRPVQ